MTDPEVVIADLQEVLKKHGLVAMIGSSASCIAFYSDSPESNNNFKPLFMVETIEKDSHTEVI